MNEYDDEWMNIMNEWMNQSMMNDINDNKWWSMMNQWMMNNDD